MPTKTPTTKTPAVKAPRKPKVAAKKKEVVAPIEEVTAVVSETPEITPTILIEKPVIAKGRYVFATGRRKTAVANIRLFSGSGELIVNKKPLKEYFNYTYYTEEILQPFALTGLGQDFYFTSHINGGGMHSQAGALRHGLATALASLSDEIRRVLKKNGLLTRDDRKKERKKPGLKRARRSPQWAKR